MPSRYYTNPYFCNFTKLGQKTKQKQPTTPKLWVQKINQVSECGFFFLKKKIWSIICNLRMQQYCWFQAFLRYLMLSTYSSVCTKIYLAVKYGSSEDLTSSDHILLKIIGNLFLALASNMSNPTWKLEYYVSRHPVFSA